MSRLAVALDALREAQADAPEELARLLGGRTTHELWSGECSSCRSSTPPIGDANDSTSWLERAFADETSAKSHCEELMRSIPRERQESEFYWVEEAPFEAPVAFATELQ